MTKKREINDMPHVAGIDLGTCFSAIAHLSTNGIALINNEYGNRITPSCIAVSNQEILVGEDALYVKNDPDFTFISKSKIDIGSKIEFNTPQGKLTPQDVAYHIIKHLLQYAELYLQDSVTEAVVTVPAYFNALQRRLTKEAAEKTGIKVTRIISEPTAASLTVGKIADGAKILVYDLGGGTFDCSLLEMYHGLARVISTHGDTHLGGKNFDEALAKLVCPDFNKWPIVLQAKLLDMCENAKKSLTLRNNVTVPINDINNNLLPKKISYSQFQECSSSLINKTKKCIYSCLKDADIEPSDISHVFLVGGSSRMRMVGELVEALFPIKPQILGNPDETVALGAAMHAADIAGDFQSTLLVDVIPLSLGIEIEDGICSKIIKRNTPIPVDAEQIYTTAYDNQTKVEIKIYQGENELAKNNIYLGMITLENIAFGLRGEPQILVRFSIDANGAMEVAAMDIKTESKAALRLEYDFNADVAGQDNEIDLTIANLKTLLRRKLTLKLTAEQVQIIEDALSSNNIELMQSVYEEMQE
jgi:molecular chaperone DnaK